MLLHHFYAQPGGEDAVVAAEMAALKARGHQVRLLSRSSKTMALGGALAALQASDNRSAAKELEAELDAFRPDMVHAHNLFPGWGVAPLAVLIRRHQPAVQTLHNFRWLCAKATLLRDGADCRLCADGNFLPAVRYACVRGSRLASAGYALALRKNRIQGLAERAFGRMICVSEFVKRCHEEAGFGVGRLAVKGHFVGGAPGAAAEGEGAIFVGRLSEEKGFSVLARAMQRLPKLKLSVVGEGPERALWEAKLGPRVRFLGRLDKPALQAELSRSAFCVAPSLGTETFGLAVMEAFASGLPAISSDAGGLPELVQDGVNGRVLPRGDDAALAAAMADLAANPAKARAMGQAGLELVKKNYLPEANMSRLESIYREAIEERP